MLRKEIDQLRDNLRQLLHDEDMPGVKRLCQNFSYYTLLSYLEEKETIRVIAKKLSPKLVENIFTWIKLKDQEETHKHPFSVDSAFLGYKPLDSLNFVPSPPMRLETFKKAKIDKFQAFKDSLFSHSIKSIYADKPEVLKVLNMCWTKNNINDLALRCGKRGFINILDTLVTDIKKEKSSRVYPKINIHHLFKNAIKSASLEFAQELLLKYPHEIKNTHQYLSQNSQFWLYKNPKSDDIAQARLYAQDSHLFDISFDFDKFMWLEKNNLGLKRSGYHNIDLFLPLMTQEQINTYVSLDKKAIKEKIQASLQSRLSDPNWQKPNYQLINENHRVNQYDRISKYLLYSNLDVELEQKNNKKSLKI